MERRDQDGRVCVSKLHRLDQENGTYWYYTPDGHVVGPFDTAAEREADLAMRFAEA